MFQALISNNHLRYLRTTSTRFRNLIPFQYVANFSSTVDIKPLCLPALSPTMTHGSIATWHKNPGDALAPGDILCDIETDKASVGFEFQDEGVLAKILVDSKGAEIKIGHPIAFVVNDASEYEAFLKLSPADYPKLGDVSSTTKPAEASSTPSPSPSPTTSTTIPPSPPLSTPNRPTTLSPAARHLVETKSLDVSNITGSSKGGRIITKEDVLNGIKSGKVVASSSSSTPAIASSPSTPLPSSSPVPTPPPPQVSTVSNTIGGTFTDIPNSNMRKVIAKRLTESKLTVPHQYTSIECDITELLSLRNKFKKDANVNVSVNDLVIKASALALRDVPECNGYWNQTKGIAELNPTIDISVAVATPNGLITPIVAQVDQLGLSSISSKVKDLAGRARDGKLKPTEYQGGTFTISNLGMFGISSFTAVINPPQACILAVGSGIQRIIPDEKDINNLKVTTTMTVQLSSDRRVVDEATAGQFLQAFRAYLSNPTLLLL